ncbi:MAG TPA: leucyl aminopeptidase [Anaerolineae bacterium]
MEIHVKKGSITDEAADLLVVNLFQGVAAPGGATGAVDRALNGALAAVLAAGDFAGKSGETLLLYSQGVLPAPRVLVVGLGDRAKFDLNAVRNAAATAARKARDLGVKTFASIVHGAGAGGLDPRAAGQATIEGSLLGLYRFEGYRSSRPQDWKPDPQSLTLVDVNAEALGAIPIGVARAEAIVRGVKLARDMVNEPANHMTPSLVAERATALAEETGLRVAVLGKQEIEALGMGIFLAVARASVQEPRFVILEHNAGRTELPTVVLCGKGVTFDSGGISIKPADEMWRMKDDMAGGAAVIAALGVAARLNLPVHAVGLVPLAENLPGGDAQKPGDVFVGMTGKTMEVISTDAEGRMLLADALAYAGRFNPAAVVDIATLTGAQAVALGPEAAGVFCNDEDLAARLLGAAATSGERLWRLPLYDEYAEAIKSQVADVKNSGGRTSGIGTSAKFLEHFTDGYPWAHIDMASMAWGDEDRPTRVRGATGYGVRLLTQFLEGFASP